MNAQKAAYWLALAVFGLALHSSYRNGSFPSLHQAAARTGSEVCWLTSRAEQVFAMARVLTGRDVFRDDDYLPQVEVADLAHAQAEFLRDQTRDKAELFRDQILAQADISRAELQMRRAQIQQIRTLARQQVRVVRTANRRLLLVSPDACGHSRFRISTATGPQISVSIPDDEADSSQD